jgi:hypothetical protein
MHPEAAAPIPLSASKGAMEAPWDLISTFIKEDVRCPFGSRTTWRRSTPNVSS